MNLFLFWWKHAELFKNRFAKRNGTDSLLVRQVLTGLTSWAIPLLLPYTVNCLSLVTDLVSALEDPSPEHEHQGRMSCQHMALDLLITDNHIQRLLVQTPEG